MFWLSGCDCTAVCRQAVGMTTCNWTGGEEHLALRSTLVEQIHVVLDELEREVGAVPVRRHKFTGSPYTQVNCSK